MRWLDEIESEVLRHLDGDVRTEDIIVMLRDLSEILAKEGLVLRSRVAAVGAERLQHFYRATAT